MLNIKEELLSVNKEEKDSSVESTYLVDGGGNEFSKP